MLRDAENGAAGADLSSERLAAEITTLSAHLAAAMCRWLELVAEFDRRQAWVEWGCRSCAHFIGWRCSISPGAAREHVRVARRLEEMPSVRAAFARGELSFSKVRALSRLEPLRDDDGLVELARTHTAAQLERVVRSTRRVTTTQAADARERRRLILEPRDDGTVSVRGLLSAEDGAVLRRALDLATEALVREGEIADASSPSATAADALVRLADSVIVTGPAGRATADRHEVVVHVDVEALTGGANGRGGHRGAAGGATVGDDLPISVETARRLCCDAGIVVHAHGAEGEPLAVGRRTRTVPPAIRRALRARDAGCRFPGCTATRWVDAHHVNHWADGGRTDLDNLVLLCRHHHRLVHEHGFTIRASHDEGAEPRWVGRGRRMSSPRLEFATPEGQVLRDVPAAPTGDPGALVGANLDRGIRPDARTSVPGWAGEPFDLDLSTLAFVARCAPPSGAAGVRRSDDLHHPPEGTGRPDGPARTRGSITVGT